MDSDSTYPVFSIFAFFGFIVALIPLPWHLQAWNSGTCIYMVWTSLACLIEFVDSIVWRSTARDIAPIWCDISTKCLIGAGVGIPAASLCINRRLYKITSISSVSVTREEKRRDVFIDLCIGVGIPVLVMILHVVVQGHRFNILEDVGCVPEIYNTPPAYPLVFMWPVLIGCISFVYAALTLRRFWIRRAKFQQYLSSNNSITAGRYFRLMLLACAEMACTIPIGAYSIFINTDGVDLEPWISWSDTHFDFWFVEEIPALIWKSNRAFYISAEMGRWVYLFAALLFFSLFGFAEEARKHYRLAFWWVAKRLGFQPLQASASKGRFAFGKGIGSVPSLPPYSPPARNPRKSFDSDLSIGLDSVSNIDLEKGMPSPSAASEDCDAPLASPDVEQSADRVANEVRTEESSESASTPAYHRPFTPPSVQPLTQTQPFEFTDAIQVTIQTESTRDL
ncbi:fungal pheromone receptor [Gelatoporia subvermispora B]|uniref:Fungal pheromone receptor n=1 Tax=Ceriporiopsis subvermispora (strain B) TaxID=914234 RepID=M2R910_CERS8|nr:fungal pheromone receptor [Gelatoporia subvermispora B]